MPAAEGMKNRLARYLSHRRIYLPEFLILAIEKVY